MPSAGNSSVYAHQVRSLRDLKGINEEEALGELIDAGRIPDDLALRNEILEEIKRQTAVSVRPVRRIPQSGPTRWPEDFRSEDGYHWTVQRDFLRGHVGRLDAELNDLHNASDQVLRDLGWPGSDDPFDIRGVAVGHIQSGKTQNFSAVIAKALDAGYRIVIVLSGMHNSLRNQTQKRLMRDLGHIGASVCEELPGHTGPCIPPSAGLPRSPDGSQWLNWLTQIDPDDDPGGGDFKLGNIGGEILATGKHIAVIKKEKTRLEGLRQFVNGNIPDGVPILVIDDESDQASVHTGPDENDPTTINALIRVFLNDMTNKSSYVGYTATPYANFFTDPTSWADEAGASLYPKDFIDLLPEPPGPPEGHYIGLESLFGDTPFPGYRRVNDVEAGSINAPPGHGAATQLRLALRDYFLATAGRVHRSGLDAPCTMLIHTAWQMEDHKNIVKKLKDFIGKLKLDWESCRDATEDEFRTLWEDDFSHSHAARFPEDPFPAFEDILPHLDDAIRSFSVEDQLLLLNSGSPDELDFDTHPGLKAILVGGNKLSRGITIEGLLVSYYVRETLAFDTLQQMGRWFGYRGGFVDLTRIYTTKKIFRCFQILRMVERELRDEITSLSRNPDITPLDVPPRLSILPGMVQMNMELTSRPKLGASSVTNTSWAGTDARTLHPYFDNTEILGWNLDHTKQFVRNLGPPKSHPIRNLPGHLPCWSEIGAQTIANYIRSFTVKEEDFSSERVASYIEEQNGHGELTRWFVVIGALQRQRSGYPSLGLHVEDDRWRELHTIKRTRRSDNPVQLGGLWDGDHEAWGLTTEQLAAANDYHEGFRPAVSRARTRRQFRHATEALLVIYPISRLAKPENESEKRTQLPVYQDPVLANEGPDIIGMALSFPVSTSAASRNVRTVAVGGIQ